MTNLPDETDLTAKIAAMERELAELPKRQTTVERSGSSTAFAGDQNTVIPGKVLGDVIQVYHLPAGKPRLSDKDVERILAEYLRWVRDAYDRARLFGMEGAPAARPGGVVPMEQLLDKVWGPECRGGPPGGLRPHPLAARTAGAGPETAPARYHRARRGLPARLVGDTMLAP